MLPGNVTEIKENYPLMIFPSSLSTACIVAVFYTRSVNSLMLNGKVCTQKVISHQQKNYGKVSG